MSGRHEVPALKLGEGASRKSVTVYPNGIKWGGQVVEIPETSLEAFAKAAQFALRAPAPREGFAQRVFTADGKEVKQLEELRHEEFVFLSWDGSDLLSADIPQLPRHMTPARLFTPPDENAGRLQDPETERHRTSMEQRTARGEEVTVDYHDGSTYKGQMVEGKRHGTGRYTFPNGESFNGEWVHGGMTGFGTYAFANGDVYSGEFRDGKRHGTGSHVFAATNDRYEGEWVNDMRSGMGCYFFGDGGMYQGTFLMGHYYGHGKMRTQDGSEYEGDWVNDLPAGHGHLRTVDGGLYEGHLQGGFFDGYGKFVAQDGTSHDGVWKSHKLVEGFIRTPTRIIPVRNGDARPEEAMNPDTPIVAPRTLSSRKMPMPHGPVRANTALAIVQGKRPSEGWVQTLSAADKQNENDSGSGAHSEPSSPRRASAGGPNPPVGTEAIVELAAKLEMFDSHRRRRSGAASVDTSPVKRESIRLQHSLAHIPPVSIPPPESVS